MTDLSDETVDYCMEQLKVWGKVRLHCENGGWACILSGVRMPRGIEFSVYSEICHKEPVDAARECLKRARKVIGDLTSR